MPRKRKSKNISRPHQRITEKLAHHPKSGQQVPTHPKPPVTAKPPEPFTWEARQELRGQVKDKAKGMDRAEIDAKLAKLRESSSNTDQDQARLHAKMAAYRSREVHRGLKGSQFLTDYGKDSAFRTTSGYEGNKEYRQLQDRLAGTDLTPEERTAATAKLAAQKTLRDTRGTAKRAAVKETLGQERYDALYGAAQAATTPTDPGRAQMHGHTPRHAPDKPPSGYHGLGGQGPYGEQGGNTSHTRYDGPTSDSGGGKKRRRHRSPG